MLQIQLEEKRKPSIMNLSGVQIDNKEEEILQKGLKQCSPPIDANAAWINLVADLTVRIGAASNVHRKLADFITKTPIPSLDSHMKSSIKGIKNKFSGNILILTKFF